MEGLVLPDIYTLAAVAPFYWMAWVVTALGSLYYASRA